jgi:hypothetical protein
MARPRGRIAQVAAACAVTCGAAALVCGAAALAGARGRGASPGDGHARPRALAFDAQTGRLFVALSTDDAVAVVDPAGPRVEARVHACRFPDALVALPAGGALVACRFEPGLRRIARDGAGRWRVTRVEAGPTSGARGLALSPDGALAYVASPAERGVAIVSIADPGAGVVARVPTGLSPRALRVVPAGALPGARGALLLVSSFVERRVTVHEIAGDGRLGPPIQTISTEAPVLDLEVAGTPPTLLLFSHEDRPLSRAHLSVEGLDSGVLRLPARAGGDAGPPFFDAGPGKRAFTNLSERAAEPVVEPVAVARDAAGALAVVGAGTDDLLLLAPGARDAAGTTVTVGTSPVAVAALPGGRWVTADRLSDTLTFVETGAGPPRVAATLPVGEPARASAAELGEVLFYGRALTPHNVADGPLSLYTCAACHDDGHVDGRRHPSKRNRFYSMTKTCRGIGATAPYLSLGEPDTIEAFADNIVATHAQGAEGGPEDYDRYPVTLRLGAAEGGHAGQVGWRAVTLSPDEVRAALAAYMARIPTEPSPYVAPGRRALTAEERRGLAVFRDGCAGCHELVGDTARGDLVPARQLERRLLAGQVALASPRLYDVGTPVLGKTGNNPPSLRGVWDAAPYFSDGSARTLEDVLRRTDPAAEKVHAPANAERPPAWSAEERTALLAFLRAL